MEKHVLSKSTFIRGVQCLKSLYLNKRHPLLRDRLPDSQRAVFKRGTDVGMLAQQLFPKGINLRPNAPSQFRKRATDTAKIINTGAFNTLYEAVFQFDKLLAILDILVRGNEGWFAYEVKSSTKITETYLLDAAYQYFVITNSGVRLEDFFLVYVNKDYDYDGTLDLERLFIKQSVLSEVFERQKFISEKVKEEKQILLKKTIPEIKIGPWCHEPYPCDFSGYCWKNVPENSILYLDSLDKKERFDLYMNGKDDPEVFESDTLSEKQRIQIGSARNKSAFIDKDKLSRMFDSPPEDMLIVAPYFLRPAVPYLLNTHPYQPVPVACGTCISKRNKEITFFIQENNAIEIFISFFRKNIEKYSKIIIYDKNNLLDFLNEKEPELVEEVLQKCIELSEAFRSDALFDYRLKGNYSPQNVAQIFLEKNYPLLDPSLLNMNWQVGLAAGDTKKELMESTQDYLYELVDFQKDFTDLLMNPDSLISSKNK